MLIESFFLSFFGADEYFTGVLKLRHDFHICVGGGGFGLSVGQEVKSVHILMPLVTSLFRLIEVNPKSCCCFFVSVQALCTALQARVQPSVRRGGNTGQAWSVLHDPCVHGLIPGSCVYRTVHNGGA